MVNKQVINSLVNKQTGQQDSAELDLSEADDTIAEQQFNNLEEENHDILNEPEEKQ
jgi:hypothetical protein